MPGEAAMDAQATIGLFDDLLDLPPTDSDPQPDDDEAKVIYVGLQCRCSWCVPKVVVDIDDNIENRDAELDWVPDAKSGGQKRETKASSKDKDKGTGKGKCKVKEGTDKTHVRKRLLKKTDAVTLPGAVA